MVNNHWLVLTGTMEFWMTFQSYWECHHPNWLEQTMIFQRGMFYFLFYFLFSHWLMCLIHHLGIIFFLALKIHLQTPEAPRRTHGPSGEWSESASESPQGRWFVSENGDGPDEMSQFSYVFHGQKRLLSHEIWDNVQFQFAESSSEEHIEKKTPCSSRRFSWGFGVPNAILM